MCFDDTASMDHALARCYLLQLVTYNALHLTGIVNTNNITLISNQRILIITLLGCIDPVLIKY